MKITKRASARQERGSTEHPLEQALAQAQELGFDGIELCLQVGAWSFDLAASWSEEMIEGTKALCQQYGVSIESLSSDWAWAYASFHPTFQGWGRGVELMGDDARLAQALGAHTILIHLATSKGSWEDCKAVLKDAAQAAGEYGVALGYEANIWERINLGGFDGLLRMVDEIGSPYFGVYLHNSYPRAGLPLHEEIERAGHRLVKAMHSSSLVSGQVEIDWEQAIPAMKQYFADGVYVFETGWEAATASKELVDEAITAYW
jgi:sugar phosphate isomerase/epimerase